MGLYRSLAFVPGNNARFLEKSRGLPADIVCLDLEDSVPPGRKGEARRMARAELDSGHRGRVFLRTNDPDSGLLEEDMEAVGPGLDGIVLPKVSDAGQLGRAVGILEAAEKRAGLRPLEVIPSLESARGVANAREIAAPGRVRAVVFGVFDFLDDMGVEYTKFPPGAAHARSLVPLAARAEGKAAIDGIWQDLADAGGLERDCAEGRSLGYAGKSVIHPGQLEAVHRLFAPTRKELEWARRVRSAYEESASRGRGATSVDGAMIDEVHYKRALDLLKTA